MNPTILDGQCSQCGLLEINCKCPKPLARRAELAQARDAVARSATDRDASQDTLMRLLKNQKICMSDVDVAYLDDNRAFCEIDGIELAAFKDDPYLTLLKDGQEYPVYSLAGLHAALTGQLRPLPMEPARSQWVVAHDHPSHLDIDEMMVLDELLVYRAGRRVFRLRGDLWEELIPDFAMVPA